MKRFTRLSLVLMVAVIAYWAYAYGTAPDFRNLDGTERFRAASGVFGRTEVGWVVEQHNLMIWTATDGTGRLLPVLGDGNTIAFLLDSRFWTEFLPSSRIPWLPPGVGQVNAVGRWPDGTITGRLTFVPIWWLVLVFGAAPAFVVARRAQSRLRRVLQRQRLERVRRKRSRMGRCACGYDLRHSRSNCPECGCPIRWVPVPWP